MISLYLQLALVSLTCGVYAATAPSVTIQTPRATIIGSSKSGIDSFRGIPFAQAPVKSLRLEPPLPITTALGTIEAVSKGLKCGQYNDAGDPDMSEDCLTLSIQRPSTAQVGSGLPVVVWIHGGGFITGSADGFNASNLILRSVNLGGPIIYVAVNYRLGAFGFLAGQEVLDSGISNLGLLDQRLALEWVADNINQFGGNASKVTIWGESAGSISVFSQMVLFNGNNTYKGSPLFRGAMLNSGSIAPTEPVNCTKSQNIYNTVVKTGGCSSATDTLACLRGLTFNKFLAASDAGTSTTQYASIADGFKPRPDGILITDSPEVLVNRSQYTRVPFINGAEEDEGTSFALPLRNITTTTDIINYFATNWFLNAPRNLIAQLVNTYPNNPSAGSPFRTGSMNNSPYTEYKRMAAIIGDLGLIMTRRLFLANANIFNPDIPTFGYIGSQNHGTPIVGTKHAADLAGDYGQVASFFSTSVQTYYISFINALDPNALAKGLRPWPRWSVGQDLLWFQNTTNTILADDFRNASYTILYDNTSMFRI